MAHLRFLGLLATALAPLPLLALDAPAHPTLLTAEYRGRTVPVVAVEKETAIALVDGQRRKLSARTPLRTDRVPDFGPGRATVALGQLSNLQLVTAATEIDVEKVVGTPGATLGGYMEFAATVTADRDLTDCYVALVSFLSGFVAGAVDKPDAQIRLRQIPDLAAGRPTEVKFSTEPFLGDARQRTVVVLLFSGAEEIYTGSNTMAWRYFQRREQVLHRAALAAWLGRAAGRDAPPAPALQFPPLFTQSAALPAGIEAELAVGADGEVGSVALPDGLAADVRDTLERTLRAWRFYPKLVGGQPVPARVRVPLRF